MIGAAILASWLLTQQWSWDRSPSAEAVAAYRVYAMQGPTISACYVAEFPEATSCGVAAGCGSESRCCGVTRKPPWRLTFFVVTAVDAAGKESSTEHGLVVPCP